MGWNQVRWTEAHQIASLMGIDRQAMPDPGVTPQDHFRRLRAADDRSGAVEFMGHALPRLEALAWAVRILEQEAGTLDLEREDRQALDVSLRWLGDPSDGNRRAARTAADAAGERSPERVLAMGVFFSGGSISEPELPPVAPAPELAGRLAASAIMLAAARARDRAGVLDRALELGDRIATDGLRALEPA